MGEDLLFSSFRAARCLERNRVVFNLHLPVTLGLSTRLSCWVVEPLGSLTLEMVALSHYDVVR